MDFRSGRNRLALADALGARIRASFALGVFILVLAAFLLAVRTDGKSHLGQ